MTRASGGTAEVFLVSVVVWLFGLGPVALRLVSMASRAVAALLVWRIGRRMASESAGRVAGVHAWVAPAAGVWGSTKAYEK
ncbi:MAG: hypothetical protein ACR2LQ_01815 [Acidimicrobiales bacterium]